MCVCVCVRACGVCVCGVCGCICAGREGSYGAHASQTTLRWSEHRVRAAGD